jgi:hypothetical protein
MSTSFVSYTHEISSDGLTLNPAIPTGVQDRDLLVALIGSEYAAGLPSVVPSGWDLLGTATRSTYFMWLLYMKIAESEGSSYSWQWTMGGRKSMILGAYRGGFSLGNTVDDFSNEEYQESNPGLRAGSLYSRAKNTTLIFAGSVSYLSVVTCTAPTSPGVFTEDIDVGSAGPRFSHFMYHLSDAGYGATGYIDAIMSTSSASAKHAFGIALNPGNETGLFFGKRFS